MNLYGVSAVFILIVTIASSQCPAKRLSPQTISTSDDTQQLRSTQQSLKGHPAITKDYKIVDSIQKNLKHEAWDDDEAPCYKAVIDLLEGVKNQTLWAVWAWNSMQPSSGIFYGSQYHQGNFDQCLQTPWSEEPGLRTQYCLVDVKMSEVGEYDGQEADPYQDVGSYIGKETIYGRSINTLVLGVCLPEVCKSSSISKISRYIHKLSNLPLQDVSVDPRDCQVAGKHEYTKEFAEFWYIILLLATISFVVYLFEIGNNKSDSLFSRVARCFSYNRNFEALKRVSKGELKVLNGMRFLTCGTLIVAHYFVFICSLPVANHLDFEYFFMKSQAGRMVSHLDKVVDTFILMSGLLLVKGLMAGKSNNVLKVLCKRYLRLVVPYALTVWFFGHVLHQLGSGPMWPRLTRGNQQTCATTSWRNLLMMGNKANDGKFCIFVAWYLHCDYQLTILGTMIFFIYRMNKRGGYALFTLAFLMSMIIPAAITYWNELPGTLLYNMGADSLLITHNKVFNTIYIHAYSRSSAYLVGMAMGYVLSVYEPQDYRKILSKKPSIVFGTFGLLLLVFVMLIGASSVFSEYNPIKAAIVAGTERSIWAIGICLVIVACEYGTFPIVSDFLGSKMFVPLARLSYGSYLAHSALMSLELYSLRAPFSYSFVRLLIYGVGYAFICAGISYLMWFTVEAPMTNLTNVLLPDGRKQTQQNGVSENGAGVKKIN